MLIIESDVQTVFVIIIINQAKPLFLENTNYKNHLFYCNKFGYVKIEWGSRDQIS